MEYIAHRGKTKEALENTLEAFIEAGKDQHYVGIECDIHSTLDGVFVVHHDETLKRLADDERNIIDVNYEDIKDIELSDETKSYALPTLESFLDICMTYKKIPMIEIKRVSNIEHLNQLLIMLELYHELNPIIISFNINYLKYLRAISNLELYFLTKEITEQNMYDCRVNEINYYINKESIDKLTIKTLKSKGFKIGVFTVNDEETEEEAKKLNIDYLTTDCL